MTGHTPSLINAGRGRKRRCGYDWCSSTTAQGHQPLSHLWKYSVYGPCVTVRESGSCSDPVVRAWIICTQINPDNMWLLLPHQILLVRSHVIQRGLPHHLTSWAEQQRGMEGGRYVPTSLDVMPQVEFFNSKREACTSTREKIMPGIDHSPVRPRERRDALEMLRQAKRRAHACAHGPVSHQKKQSRAPCV